MKTIIGLMLVWLVILTGTFVYVLNCEKAFLKFADLVVDDNLKNVIVAGGKTFLIAEMLQVDIGRPDLPIKLYGPVYMDADEMEKMVTWKQKNWLMVRDYERMDLESRIQMAKVNTWFKQRLAETQERKDKAK